MLDVLEYLDAAGRSPVKRWFDRLDANASAKVTFAITRISQGNLSNAKAVGGGVFEFKIDFDQATVCTLAGTESASSFY